MFNKKLDELIQTSRAQGFETAKIHILQLIKQYTDEPKLAIQILQMQYKTNTRE